MRLKFLDQQLAVCQLPPDAEVPDWAAGEFVASIRTSDELTVVCSHSAIPDSFDESGEGKISQNWIGFGIDQTLDFEMVGVIARLSRVLAEAKVPIFVISSYNTDYVLIPDRKRETAIKALQAADYQIVGQP